MPNATKKDYEKPAVIDSVKIQASATACALATGTAICEQTGPVST